MLVTLPEPAPSPASGAEGHGRMARLELERQRGVLVAFPRRRLERARRAGMRDQPVQELNSMWIQKAQMDWTGDSQHVC